jgi:glycosyltransferase involved in cell wall biosynthesis
LTRIVFLSNFYFPFIGGAEEVCRMEAEELCKRGYEVFVVTSSMPGSREREDMRGVKVLRVRLRDISLKRETSSSLAWLAIGLVNSMLSNNLLNAQAVKRVIESLRPDVVHVHNVGGKIPLLTLRTLRRLRVPVVMTLHDYRLICPRATLFCHAKIPCRVPKFGCDILVKLQRTLLKNCVTKFISPSRFLADRLKEKLGEADVVVVPNPLQRIEAKPKEFLEPFQVLYVGRLVWYKGIHVLLEAFKKLKRENARLIIAGSGPELETVKRLSKTDDRIISLGFISEEEKRKLLIDASLVAVPSLWPEPFPMTILESFGSGTPVVASKVGGIPEIVRDGVNGMLFEPGDSEKLSTILTELSENEENLRRLSEGAAESARQYYIEKHIELLETIYLELLG